MTTPTWLFQGTILLTLGGSRAYGTNTPSSDVDVKGVAIPPARYFHGFVEHFEQADKPGHMQQFLPLMDEELRTAAKNTKLEGTIYDIRKFMALAADGNPNILDVLFAEDSDVILMDPLGAKLRRNRDKFLSKVVKHP